ncbi:MAG: hypothetical protein NT079_04095 [Candidatus Omnitrophica bacterium]|nr:hypothetical protein [Candidatus Omnitrophota bacterium]
MSSFMGVIYKLKQEVINYILKLKRADQGLGCRKIAELASTHFQTTISKSSVNAVLKDSSLSSSVGRRANKQKRKSEKFKIPEHRKEQIFVNAPLSILGEPRTSAPSLSIAQPPNVESLGTLFLKAAEWQMKRQGVLRFFCEKFGPILCEEKILKLAEAFLFLPLFGEHDSERFADFNKEGLWAISNIDSAPTMGQKQESYDALLNLEKRAQEVTLEYGQIFSEASFFQFTLEDGTEFCIDGQMNSSWGKDNVQSDFSVSLDKSIDLLSKNFVINTTSMILREATTEEPLPSSFFNMISSFENMPGKRIRRVDMMTSQKEVVSSFDKIVEKKRYYISGLYGSRGLLSKFVPNKKQEPKQICSALTQEVYYCWKATTAFRLPDGRQISADMALISQKKDESPLFAILTNIPADVRPIENVVGAFLEKWPHPLNGHKYLSERQKRRLHACCDIVGFPDEKSGAVREGELFKEKDFLSEFANAVLGGLHDYSARHFFHPHDCRISFSDAQERFYSLRGTIKKEQGLLKVALSVPLDYVYRNELNFLIQRVDESEIVDPKGYRLAIEIHG